MKTKTNQGRFHSKPCQPPMLTERVELVRLGILDPDPSELGTCGTCATPLLRTGDGWVHVWFTDSHPPVPAGCEDTVATGDVADPGPVPEVVEPQRFGRQTTIRVSPRVELAVTEDVGGTGCTGLTVALVSGEHVTVALPAAAVDALIDALATSVPVAYEPMGGAS